MYVQASAVRQSPCSGLVRLDRNLQTVQHGIEGIEEYHLQPLQEQFHNYGTVYKLIE